VKISLQLLLFSITPCLASLKEELVEHYANVLHATYCQTLGEAKILDEMIGDFVGKPTGEGFSKIKAQWVKSRLPYSQTEVARFYDGPIDDENGFEGWINAWPIDEAYLDYVRGKPEAGLINNSAKARGIDEETLFELNEQGGEADICTGYHAIEFLLWGQDFFENSPGQRPFADYTSEKNAKRRRDALQACSRLLVTHLSTLAAEWSPEKENYRDRFTSAPAGQSLSKILTGMSMLSGFELASERLAVAYDTRNQEDEHSCFSDTTHLDLCYNIKGIQNVWRGEFQAVRGPGIRKLAEAAAPALAAEITRNLDQCLLLAEGIPVPFDQAVRGEEDAPGRIKILECIESLEHLNQNLLILAEKTSLGVSKKASQ
jgi:putative iron-regulated protein